MDRILAAFLVFAGAAHASVLRANASAGSTAVAIRGERADPDVMRAAACRACHKLCPISCFVGTCGMQMAYAVRRYQATNQCYSCDPSVSVGVAKDGDFLKCEAFETGEDPKGKSAYSQQESVREGPRGPAIAGDAGLNALKATQQAQVAVQSATKASIFADRAAKAAVAKYREATGTDDGQGSVNQIFSAEQQAENHLAATQIRAEEALRTAEAAHTAWKVAMGEYNKQLLNLRRQQLLTDQAEKQLEAAETRSEKARGQYASMQAEAKAAMTAAMSGGGSAADKITSQAAAEELAGAAMAAHRRLVIAAKEAKDASDKIAIATAMAPCMDASGTATSTTGCTSIQQQAQTMAANTNFHQEANDQTVQMVAQPPATPQQDALGLPPVTRESVAGLGDNVEEPVAPMTGKLEVPSIEQQVQQQLAEKLATSPQAVQDPSTFAVPAIPFSAQQAPVDGMEAPPSFDLSTISTLQIQKRGLQKSLRHQGR